jgi:TPR repeat protein
MVYALTSSSPQQQKQKLQQPKEAPINKLSEELILRVLSFLARRKGGEKDLVSCSLVCKAWKQPAEHTWVWGFVADRLSCPSSFSTPDSRKEYAKLRLMADRKLDPVCLRKIGLCLDDKILAFEYMIKACRLADAVAMEHIVEVARSFGIEEDETCFSMSEVEEYVYLEGLAESIRKLQAKEENWPETAYSLAIALLINKSCLHEHRVVELGLHYMKEAAQGGNMNAKVILGEESLDEFQDHFYYPQDIRERLSKTRAEFFPLYVRALEKNGLHHRAAKLYLKASLPYFKQLPKECADYTSYLYCKEMAKRGNPKYLDVVGMFHYEGRGGVEKSCVMAESCWKQAWEKGFLDSAYHLGNLYVQGGVGVEQSYQKALGLYLAVVKKNSSYWQVYFELAHMYQNGLGVEKDERKAYQLLTIGEREKQAQEAKKAERKEIKRGDALRAENKYMKLFDTLRTFVIDEVSEASETLHSMEEQAPVSRKRKRDDFDE